MEMKNKLKIIGIVGGVIILLLVGFELGQLGSSSKDLQIIELKNQIASL